MPTSSPRPPLSLTVNDWHQDTKTGVVTYDLDASAGGLAGVGEPCAWPTSGCGWQVTGWYKNGTTTIGQGYLSGSYGSLAQGQWSFDTHLQGAIAKPEITDLELSVTNGDVTRDVWVHVSGPVTGSLHLSVQALHRDSSTGSTSFDLRLIGQGLAAVGEPCASSSCYWIIYTLDASSSINGFLAQGGLTQGTWGVAQTATGTRTVSTPFTALQAVVSNGDISRTVTLAVDGADEVGNINVSSFMALLAARGLTQAEFCADAADAPMRTNVGETSPGDQATACLAGSGIRDAILRMLATAGGAAVAWYLIHQYAEQQALEDHTVSVGAPTTAPPILPPVYDEDGVAAVLEATNPGLSDEDAHVITRQCMWLLTAAGTDGTQCGEEPIFVSGRDVPEATDHDLAAIGARPQWVRLNYERGADKPGSGWQICQDRVSGQQCDEYPFFASEQGGPRAVPAPDLRPIDADDNQYQGGYYSTFAYAKCHLTTGTPPPDRSVANSTGGQAFWSVPLPPTVGASTSLSGRTTFPSMALCGDGENFWVAPPRPTS